MYQANRRFPTAAGKREIHSLVPLDLTFRLKAEHGSEVLLNRRISERVETIGRITYLERLSPAERTRLAEACEFRDFDEGAELFAEAAPAAGIFLVLQGRVKLVRSSAEGREQVLHEEGPGATLGEVPAFDGQGYVATAIAVGRTSVFFVPRAPLLEAIERNPASARAVIAVLAARVRKFAALAEDLSLRPVTERLAGYLVREAARTGLRELTLPLTRDQLASHIGTVREQVSRALSQLKKEGLIDVQGRRATVLELERLRLRAGSGHRS